VRDRPTPTQKRLFVKDEPTPADADSVTLHRHHMSSDPAGPTTPTAHDASPKAERVLSD